MRELQALRDADAQGAFNLDAGLNLNIHAFRNLAAAEREVGFFRDRALVCEAYPTLMTEEHYAFLARCKTSYIGVGLQSFNGNVLKAMDRPFREEKFDAVVRAMAEGALERTAANVAIAVSGIAGPAGAVPGKPVGTVWIAIAQRAADRVECQGHLVQFDGNRDAVRRHAVEYALNLLRALPAPPPLS